MIFFKKPFQTGLFLEFITYLKGVLQATAKCVELNFILSFLGGIEDYTKDPPNISGPKYLHEFFLAHSKQLYPHRNKKQVLNLI